MEVKYLIEHKDSRVFVKDINKGVAYLTLDPLLCFRFDTIKEADDTRLTITNHDRFEITEYGIHN